MGVPSFYKWLVGKYPNIVVPSRDHNDGGAWEEAEEEGGGPNGVYHNLYLDMNGIIHPCFHPEDQVCPPTRFDEVFQAMFQYMDRLFRIVRPTRLFYLAVDGVAPRAKMNQQRSRRFKAAKDAKEAKEKLLRDRFRAEGKEVLPKETYEVSDPNVITPGTEFMEKLSTALEYYIRARLNSDPAWKNIKVFLSDSNVPGEGEHKIMSFIRAQRSSENYDPNTRHCLYGLDADLIMLALASHEPHFSILREDVVYEIQPENAIPLSKEFFKTEESSRKYRGWFPRTTEERATSKIPKKSYQFLNIWVLRVYLEIDLKILNPIIKTDIEKLVDDFIFICFLTGNDFIPPIPSLDIREDAVDLLIEVYKTNFNKMGGYIVNTEKVKDKHAAYLKVSRLEKFFHELSLCEEKIFVKRYSLQESYQCKILRQAAEKEWNERDLDNAEENPDGSDLIAKSLPAQCTISSCSSEKSDITANTLELRRNLKDALRKKQDLITSGASNRDRIGIAGWKSRFYREKFGIENYNDVGKLKMNMVQKYLEGLCWVLQYYFADVPSWSWYYPFYYAPFASDLKGLSQFKISFTMNKPLKPFDQLMAVLPPEVSFALPKCYRELMEDEGSSIQKFYPSDLKIDTHGKRFLWQGIAMLPFIDEQLLLSATKTLENNLAMHEMSRNTVRNEKIFLGNANTLAKHGASMQISDSSSIKLPIDPSTSELTGWLAPTEDDGLCGGFFRSPIKDLQDIRNDQTVSFMFFNPEAVKPVPRLLQDVRLPEKTLTEDDISRMPLWHTYPGYRPPPVTTAAAATMEVQPTMISGFGRGRGRGTGTLQRSSGFSSIGRGFHGHGSDMAQRHGAYNSGSSGSAWAGRGQYRGTVQTQQQQQQQAASAWRAVEQWSRGGCGGGIGNGGGGRGRSSGGQSHGW